MQAIFTDVVNGDLEKVEQRLDKDPAALAAVATGQPKKYTRQSLLQVAIRTGRFEIALVLLQRGADPNFIDAGSPTDWTAPVLHDAISAAVKCSRWLRPGSFSDPETDWRLANDVGKADAAFGVLRAMLEAGASVDPVDSKGTSALGRAARTARDVLPRHYYNEPDRKSDKPLNAELVDDLNRIFDALFAHGADAIRIDPNLKQPLVEFYRAEPVGRFLERAQGTRA